MERVNCSSDFVAVALLPCDVRTKNAFRSAIALTRSRDGRSVTRCPLYMDVGEHAFLRKQEGSVPSSAVLVECIDPQWGRNATSRDGLFVAVADALQ